MAETYKSVELRARKWQIKAEDLEDDVRHLQQRVEKRLTEITEFFMNEDKLALAKITGRDLELRGEHYALDQMNIYLNLILDRAK